MITNNPDIAVANKHDAAGNRSAPPLPSFEERNSPADPVNLTPETRRIRWTLNGPLETAITVSRHDAHHFDPDEVPEPYHYHRAGPSGNDDANWHPFSQLPLTEPQKHDQHTDPDEKRESDIPDDQVLYGPLPPGAGADGDEELDSDGDEHLLVCCGQKRPLGKGVSGAGAVVVKPTTTGSFVTIHDFISTVHPYLMARRDEVLEAMGEDPGRTGAPFPPETTRLVVIWYSAPYVDVLDEASWMRTRKRRRSGSGKKEVDAQGDGPVGLANGIGERWDSG
ncbi:hypothetical protein C8A01DRAFT_31312 [Parachaetomium inaequale]|uniref:Uncharacterized protein n=1 Tax=Parachaetomium inaequale TaxID=2588326 RepID=A0AAN6SWC6_9PEZI|nr:hypothetical protein C8A01DRAFT_31312 [Parachaetomium inaequale]